jgi:hypothetical protein
MNAEQYVINSKEQSIVVWVAFVSTAEFCPENHTTGYNL